MIKIIIRTIYITKRNQIFFAPPHPPSVPITAGIYLLGWGTLCKTPRTVSVSPARRMPPRDLMLFMVCLNSSSERSLVASYAIRTRPGIRGLWSLVLSTVPVELDDDISLINRIPHNEFNLLNLLHSITGMGIKAAAHIKGSMQQMNNRTITNLHDKMGLWEWVLAQSQFFFFFARIMNILAKCLSDSISLKSAPPMFRGLCSGIFELGVSREENCRPSKTRLKRIWKQRNFLHIFYGYTSGNSNRNASRLLPCHGENVNQSHSNKLLFPIWFR